ncbi:hypothetical protein HNR23_004984 [Nocardiopsis mwathae]|uniref:Uncharacterized protein n=1 Tax=Nocardiopsis mwathae TaxID=1472723 RepID=A0A7W9YML0_9ACTN|nr:hypothetical protein [Nocardiopsis mwathae]MBB6174924.1 hypothetical protein [Nocardiopsis mwathae]
MTAVADARWGRTPAHAERHAQAARLQARFPQFVIWHGEYTGAWFAITATGLVEAPTVEALECTVRSLTAAAVVSRNRRDCTLSRTGTGFQRLR